MTRATTLSEHPSRGQRAVGDIADRDDLTELLRDFYGRAFRDDLLGPVFVDVARMDLEQHLPTICDFWETVLFRTGSYRRNALQPHMRLHGRTELTPAHFDRWLALWQATVTDRHAGPNADLARLQGRRIAGAMSRRITGTDGHLGKERDDERLARRRPGPRTSRDR